jgi:hypothetical protein
VSTELLNKSEIVQHHFFENRLLERHNTCYFSHVAGITLGVCKCDEYFFVHADTAFAGEKELKKLWRAHARSER